MPAATGAQVGLPAATWAQVGLPPEALAKGGRAGASPLPHAGSVYFTSIPISTSQGPQDLPSWY